MIQSVIGKKLGQTQAFLENGKRIPMTRIQVDGNVVSQIKTKEKDGYEAVQLGFGSTKKADKPTTGHSKKAGLKLTPRFFRETKADKIEGIELGQEINVEEVLSAGDIIDVTGTSKGKGYAGVVKRHHFKGGPKTHGQSDRHRAPGSIGQSTTPGRVYKGKRMAGRMGNEQVTVKNLEVIEYADGVLLVKGLIPGPISSIVTITRRGTNKKHVGLYSVPVAEELIEVKVEEIGPSIEEQEVLRQAQDEQAKAEEKALRQDQGKTEQESAQVSNQPDDAKALTGKVEVNEAKAEVNVEAEPDSVQGEKVEEASDASADVEVSEEVKKKEEKSSV